MSSPLSALLAMLFEERGGDTVVVLRVDVLCQRGQRRRVSTRLADRATPEEERRATIAELELDIRPLTAELALRAVDLRKTTRADGLLLGDRYCLALAEALGAEAVDAAWTRGGHGVRVRLIR